MVINKIRDPDGHERFRIASSFEDIMRKPSSGKDMMEIQEAYAKLIENCKAKLKTIEKNRKMRGDPMLKWDMAKAIDDFIKLVEEKGYYLTNCSKALSRDLNISLRQINYLIEFVNTFPQKELLYRQISWDKYKEILDIKNRALQEKVIQKILGGELKTREEIRKYKKGVSNI
ncbi:MAG: hypothetical protein QXO75_03995 [Nitrososphaerota archaeon]